MGKLFDLYYYENCDNCDKYWADYRLEDERGYNKKNLCDKYLVKLHPKICQEIRVEMKTI